MNFTLVAFVAVFLGIMVVSSSSTPLAPEEQDTLNRIDCIVGAVIETVQEVELLEKVEVFIKKIKSIGRKEVKCITGAKINIPKRVICRVKAGEALTDTIFRFALEIAETNADVAEKLIKVVSKCIVNPNANPNPDSFELLEDDVNSYFQDL